MSSIKINGVAYAMSDGSVFNDYYNETLDNGVALVSQSSKITVEPYDDVEISFVSGVWLKFFATDILETVASFTPELYNYQVNYVSRTIILQKIVLPNISLTQRLSGASIKIDEKIASLYGQYGPKVKGTSAYSLKFPISTRLTNFTSGTACPEFSLQAPTLFEALNTILSALDAIVTINQSGELDYILLTQTGDSVDKTSFAEISTRQVAEEYISELNSEVENGINSNTKCFTETAYITPRKPDSALITNDEDVLFMTQMPIYKIVSVTLDVPIKTNNGFDTARQELDLSPLIVEKDVYDVMSNDNMTDLPAVYVPGRDELRKKYHFYYTQGEREIRGLFRKQAWWSGTAWAFMLEALTSLVGWTWFGEDAFNEGVDERYFRLKVKYIPLTGTKMRVSRYLPRKHESFMTNNQADNYVDIGRFAKSNEQTVERIGNPEMTAIGRFASFSSVPDLGDTIDSHVLWHREIAVYDGFVLFKGTLSKAFASKTLFTGVVAKRRMWVIAKGQDAIQRNELFKIYAEFSFSDKNQVDFGTLSYDQSGKTYSNYLLSNLKWISSSTLYVALSPSARPVGCIAKTTYKTGLAGVYYSNELFMEIAPFLADRSILLTIEFFDNFSAGIRSYHTQVTGGIPQDDIRYVDGNGEISSIQLKLVKVISNGLTVNYNGGTYSLTETNKVTGQTTTRSYPIYTMYQHYENSDETGSASLPIVFSGMYQSSDVFLDITQAMWKDNREKIRFTIQNEYCADTNDIIVNKYMAQVSPLISGFGEAVNVRLYYSTTEKYTINDTVGKGTLYSATNPITVTSNRIDVASGIFNTSTCVSWAITNIYGTIILAVNKVDGESTIRTRVYLNCLRSRPF